MDLGDLVVGIVIGVVGGTVVGMTVPEEKKPSWIKSAAMEVRKKWDKYDAHKAVLEEQRAEWVKAHKERMKRKKEGMA